MQRFEIPVASKPAALPTPEDGHASLVLVEPELAALAEDEILHINVDVPRACASALGIPSVMKALRPAIAHDLPHHPFAITDKLEHYTLALYYAHLMVGPRRRTSEIRALWRKPHRKCRGRWAGARGGRSGGLRVERGEWASRSTDLRDPRRERASRWSGVRVPRRESARRPKRLPATRIDVARRHGAVPPNNLERACRSSGLREKRRDRARRWAGLRATTTEAQVGTYGPDTFGGSFDAKPGHFLFVAGMSPAEVVLMETDTNETAYFQRWLRFDLAQLAVLAAPGYE